MEGRDHSNLPRLAIQGFMKELDKCLEHGELHVQEVLRLSGGDLVHVRLTQFVGGFNLEGGRTFEVCKWAHNETN